MPGSRDPDEGRTPAALSSEKFHADGAAGARILNIVPPGADFSSRRGDGRYGAPLADMPSPGIRSRHRVPTVSLIVPTHQRLAALEDTLPSLLAVEDVDEVLFVDDGSTDGTADFLLNLSDPRVSVILQPRRLGQPAARNRGLAESNAEWILFGEDDVRLPRDYVQILLEEAAAHDAQIVGAPFLLILEGEDALPGAIAAARAQAVESVGLDQRETFPLRVLFTPFLTAPTLIHRKVVDAGVRFDQGYRGNAYREETAFFVEAVRRGFTAILTPRTVAYQVGAWQGGAHRTRYIVYEFWTIRNNWRFLAKHGRWLQREGLIDHPLRAGTRFMRDRAQMGFRLS
jgi:glycosyltransferase involved in cell wall biosynthesis